MIFNVVLVLNVASENNLSIGPAALRYEIETREQMSGVEPYTVFQVRQVSSSVIHSVANPPPFNVDTAGQSRGGDFNPQQKMLAANLRQQNKLRLEEQYLKQKHIFRPSVRDSDYSSSSDCDIEENYQTTHQQQLQSQQKIYNSSVTLALPGVGDDKSTEAHLTNDLIQLSVLSHDEEQGNNNDDNNNQNDNTNNSNRNNNGNSNNWFKKKYIKKKKSNNNTNENGNSMIVTNSLEIEINIPFKKDDTNANNNDTNANNSNCSNIITTTTTNNNNNDNNNNINNGTNAMDNLEIMDINIDSPKSDDTVKKEPLSPVYLTDDDSSTE
eukprot:Awhi_evm2s6448